MDIMDEEDFESPSEKKARYEGDHSDLGHSGGEDDASRGRRGRMRKKSAKVLEMEEFEETERKHASQAKSQGGSKKKKLLKSPQATLSPVESPSDVVMSSMKDDSGDGDDVSVTDSPFKSKLPFTPTGMAAGPPVNLPPPPPSSKSLTKKPPVKTKKEKSSVQVPLSPPPTGLETILKGSPNKDKNLFESFSFGSPVGEEVSALQMALQAELTPPPPSSAELLAKKSSTEKSASKKSTLPSPTNAPHLAAALLQAPITNPNLMMATSSSANISVGLDSSSDSDGPLIIDTHREGAKKKKSKKEKDKPVKVKVEQIGLLSSADDSIIERGGESPISSGGSDIGDLEDAPVYSNTDKMALKLMTQAEKKASKKKGKKQKKEDPEKPKKKRSPTAYMLWCSSYRGKVVAENPGIDFAQISKRLGEIWQSLPEKEKMLWKRKAKKAAGKGSTLISTGKAGGKTSSASTAAPKQAASNTTKPESKPVTNKAPSKSVTFEDLLATTKLSGTSAVDVAAHLKLLGESLSIIGSRLQEHQGQIAVQGSLSVLLDSLLCALGPLMCLTQLVKEFNGSTPDVHAKTLDNVAYFMPGIG